MLATPSARSVLKPRFAVGDLVFGASQGAYATKVVATESQLQPVPPGWSFTEAAGLFVTAPTSYAALVLRAGVKQGDYVLVHAAAGGVGLAAVQSRYRCALYSDKIGSTTYADDCPPFPSSQSPKPLARR